MKIDVTSTLTIVLGLIAIVGAIYRLAQIESNIIIKITILERKIDAHIVEYEARKEHYDYRINDFDKRLEHKFNRLANWINQVTQFLNKESGFQVRDDKF